MKILSTQITEFAKHSSPSQLSGHYAGHAGWGLLRICLAHPFCWRWCKLAAVGRFCVYHLILCVSSSSLGVCPSRLACRLPAGAGGIWFSMVLFDLLVSCLGVSLVSHEQDEQVLGQRQTHVEAELRVIACNLGFPKCPDGQVRSHDVLYLICLRTPLTNLTINLTLPSTSFLVYLTLQTFLR